VVLLPRDDDGDKGAAGLVPRVVVNGASTFSRVSWLAFWPKEGDVDLSRLGEIGRKGSFDDDGFGRGGACSTPPRREDLGDRGGVKLVDAAADLISSSSILLEGFVAGGEVTIGLVLFCTETPSGLVGLSAGWGVAGMMLSNTLSAEGPVEL